MTEIITSVIDLKKTLLDLKTNHKFHFIPTMGNLHFGHLELIEKATKESGKSLVSIFVNPLQFNQTSDFNSYPRTLERDVKFLKKKKVDYIFIPEENNFLNVINNHPKVAIRDLNKVLCGKDRFGHFEGVVSIIYIFLKIINPDFIYLGKKDFQQILIIKKVIKDLNFKTKVKILKTIREKDGVAYSSRNSNLSKLERKILPKLFKCLNTIKNEINNNKFKINDINSFKEDLIKFGFKKVNYLEIRKEANLNLINSKFSKCRIFASVTLSKTRLIDNLGLGFLKVKGSLVIREKN